MRKKMEKYKKQLDFNGNEKTWTTSDGKEIPYSKLTDSHLLNILKFVEKKAENGLTVSAGCGCDSDEMYCDVDCLYREEALHKMNYYLLRQEAINRKILNDNH